MPCGNDDALPQLHMSSRTCQHRARCTGQSPDNRSEGVRPMLRTSVIESSTCVSPRTGPSTRSFSLPFGPSSVTNSSQTYCPGCKRFLSFLSMYPAPNRASIVFRSRCTCRPDTAAGTNPSLLICFTDVRMVLLMIRSMSAASLHTVALSVC